jgi:hypothetical protein
MWFSINVSFIFTNLLFTLDWFIGSFLFILLLLIQASAAVALFVCPILHRVVYSVESISRHNDEHYQKQTSLIWHLSINTRCFFLFIVIHVINVCEYSFLLPIKKKKKEVEVIIIHSESSMTTYTLPRLSNSFFCL